jgi:hypothetical protein
MHTPAVALFWESWRLTRSRLFVVPPLAALCGWLLARGSASPLAFIVVFAAAFMMAMSLPVFGGPRGFPLFRNFARPVYTAVLVAVPLAYVLAAAAACYLVPAVFLRMFMGLNIPLLAPAALLGAATVLVAGCTWFTRVNAMRMALAVAGVVAAGAMLRFLEPFRNAGTFPIKPGVQLCVLSGTGYLMLGLAVVALYAWITLGVWQQRHGEEELSLSRSSVGEPRENSADIMVWVRNTCADVFGWRCPVSSGTAAEVWFEMRCYGLPVLVMGALLAACIPLLMKLADKDPKTTGIVLVVIACTFVAPFMAGVGASIWNRRNSVRARFSPFEAARAIDTGELIGLQVLVTSLCIAGAWLLMATSVWLSLPLLRDIHDYGSPTALALELMQTHGLRAMSAAVIGLCLLATALALMAAARALASAYGWRLWVGALAVLLYVIAMLIGVAREWIDAAVIDAHLWALAIAIPVATLLVSLRVLAGGVLTARQAVVVSIIFLVFAVLYLDMLRANDVTDASPAVEALALASTLLPLLAAGLAPWSLSRIRHA